MFTIFLSSLGGKSNHPQRQITNILVLYTLYMITPIFDEETIYIRTTNAHKNSKTIHRFEKWNTYQWISMAWKIKKLCVNDTQTTEEKKKH